MMTPLLGIILTLHVLFGILGALYYNGKSDDPWAIGFMIYAITMAVFTYHVWNWQVVT